MKRYLETGNFAITQGAMLAGCNAFAGYPITPATEIAEGYGNCRSDVRQFAAYRWLLYAG
jgi:pyruvate/2-oxoacid:ferredoxin oxidoreductase alpha subunit